MLGAESLADTVPAAASASGGLFAPPTPPLGPPPPRGLALLYPDDDEPIVRLTGIDRAVDRLIEREILSPEDFYRLSGAAKQQAFTISGDLTERSIGRIRDLLAENVAGGASLKAFSDAVAAEFETPPIAGHRLEQIYRNAVNESFSQGAETILDHPLAADAQPYRVYVAIHDARARPEHTALETLGLDGTAVFHKSDPTWRRFRPPWSWGCRCGWIAVGIEEAARRGVKEAQQWLETGIEPAHTWVQPPPFSPPAGWERMEALSV